MKIKAILDTNVFISGVFWKGPSFEILKPWQERRFRLAVSLPILNEYRRVLAELSERQQMPVLNSVLKVVEIQSQEEMQAGLPLASLMRETQSNWIAGRSFRPGAVIHTTR